MINWSHFKTSKQVGLLIIMIWLIATASLHAKNRSQTHSAHPPTYQYLEHNVQARSVLLIDAQTGEELFVKNPNAPFPPASILKLMTALIVYEKTGLEGRIIVRQSDTRVEPSHIPLRAGEVVNVRDMINALLIGSDNDSAMALARYTAGSISKFVALMNERARELGCKKTVFKNPHGLPIPGQVTTARDMLAIFKKVLEISELRKIAKKKTYQLTTEIGSQTIINHNKLLGKYPGLGPAKTGWTYASRHTYAASATRDGHELLLIILNSPDKWSDAVLLFDYGFACKSAEIQNRQQQVALAQYPLIPTPAQEHATPSMISTIQKTPPQP